MRPFQPFFISKCAAQTNQITTSQYRESKRTDAVLARLWCHRQRSLRSGATQNASTSGCREASPRRPIRSLRRAASDPRSVYAFSSSQTNDVSAERLVFTPRKDNREGVCVTNPSCLLQTYALEYTAVEFAGTHVSVTYRTHTHTLLAWSERLLANTQPKQQQKKKTRLDCSTVSI